MKRRTFLRALAGGTVAALLGVQPRQLGEPEADFYGDVFDWASLTGLNLRGRATRHYRILVNGVDTGLTAPSPGQSDWSEPLEIKAGDRITMVSEETVAAIERFEIGTATLGKVDRPITSSTDGHWRKS